MLERGRKIAAILAADVVGYSRLMGLDESGTLAALKARRALFNRLVEEFDGREFGSVGDSLMAQFPSAVNAVGCAQAIQHAIARENEPLAADRRMALRIGVNLGDVIEEDGTLFGDGVNVAARLQALAAPGGILISGAVYEQVKKKVPARFNYTGVRHVKNIADLVSTYEVLDPSERHPLVKALVRHSRRWRVAAATVLALATVGLLWWFWRGDLAVTQLQALLQPGARGVTGAQPSVAVLPFVNMSSEADNEPFADGLSEEVLNVLAGIQGLKVAGRTSSFYYKNKTEKPEVIAATLGVNHLLEGSVRRSGPRVRITAQLIDATTGFHLWSESFDRELTDVFAVQEDIARSVADALRVQLLPADEARLAKRSTQNPEAHRLYLVARGRMRERGLANLRAAKALFEDAIERDPLYASAYSGLADAYFLLMYNHAQEAEDGERRGERAAQRALELDPSLSEAYASRANFALLRSQRGEPQRLEQAIADYQRAIELDPSNAQAHHWYGNAIQEKDPEAALRSLERAVELDPLMRQAQLAVADVHRELGDYARARKHIHAVIDRYPDFSGAYRSAADLEYRFGRLIAARALLSKAYQLDTDPSSAAGVYILSMELGDRATAAEWGPRVAGTPLFDLAAEAVPLSIDGKYPQALEAFSRGLDQFIADPWFAIVTSHLELIAGRPERATAMLLRRNPELTSDDTPITFANCDLAIALAAGFQRTGRSGEAGRLLRRIAAWLDSPQAPRHPARRVARAQVHALRGEREQVFDALDRAFDEGHRSTLGSALIVVPYRGEDNPAFETVRSDPRLSAWFKRVRADNARQLAQLQDQRTADS